MSLSQYILLFPLVFALLAQENEQARVPMRLDIAVLTCCEFGTELRWRMPANNTDSYWYILFSSFRMYSSVSDVTWRNKIKTNSIMIVEWA